jgi:hypothetical protein
VCQHNMNVEPVVFLDNVLQVWCMVGMAGRRCVYGTLPWCSGIQWRWVGVWGTMVLCVVA